MASKIDFSKKNIIIQFDNVSDYANLIKSSLQGFTKKCKFDNYIIQGNDMYIEIYKLFYKYYDNIIIIGYSEEKNNTICVRKNIHDKKNKIIKDEVYVLKLDEFYSFFS